MKPEDLENTIFGIVLDFTRPWLFLDQLAIWGDVIFEINKQLFLKLPVQKQNKMRRDIENHFKFYQNPDKAETEQKEAENQEGEGNDDEMKEAINEMELDEGVLNVNLGVPVIIICTKSEVVATGESQNYFQPRFDFISKNLREFALRYGAALVFTSAKKGTNMEVLHQYLMHRFFDAEFKVGPETNNKEGIFIPSGFDSPNIVGQICPNIDDPYDKIVTNISGSLDEEQEKEIEWEPWESWLNAMKDDFKVSEDDDKAPAPQDKEEEVKKKKVNTQDFFKNLIKNKNSNARASEKAPEKDAETTEKPEKFAKLRLDHTE